MDSGATERVILSKRYKEKRHETEPWLPWATSPHYVQKLFRLSILEGFLNVLVDMGYEENPCNVTTKGQLFPNKISLKKENALPKTYGFIHLGDSKGKGLDLF